MSLESEMRSALYASMNEGLQPTQILSRMVESVAGKYIDVPRTDIRGLAENLYTDITGKSAPRFLSESS